MEKRAIKILDMLISSYKSEYEGTKQYEEDKDEIEKVRKYITKKISK